MQQEEGRLTPIMREGVEIIKMIFYKRLRAKLSETYAHRDEAYIGRLTGAIINELFGTPNHQEPYATFVDENLYFIQQELRSIATSFAEMRIPLTDALRVQFLCDSQEGTDSSTVLARAKELGILIVDRDVPLPASFMNLVRRLGASFGLLVKE